MDSIPTQWNLASILNGASVRRLEYSNNTLFALSSTSESLRLLTIPTSLTAGTASSLSAFSVHIWPQNQGANCSEPTVKSTSIDKSFYSFCRSGTGKLLLFVFNGTHPQDPVPVDEEFEGWLHGAIMVNKAFMAVVEKVHSTDNRQIVSSYSFDASGVGVYTRGRLATASDDYSIVFSNTVDTPEPNDKRMLPETYGIFICGLASVLLLCVIAVFLLFGRQSRKHEQDEDMNKDSNITSNFDENDDEHEDAASQKQPARDEEDDIPWVDELPGKVVLIEEDEDCGYDSQVEVAEGRGDVIIPLSIIVAPSARSPPSTESPSLRHSPVQPPTPPLTQPLSRRQVIVLSNHPRPSYVTSIDHDANSEDEEGNQESAPALAPLTAAHWHHDTPLQTPNSVRTAAFTEVFTTPSGPSMEGVQQRPTPNIPNVLEADFEPLPAYE
ncbi:hypothetical protein DFQ27_000556 [Actinomortierella ambigua]|uniref:Uncharacterized protein n=1 Tax=Actinomortierella ambigua TaxID=1343610 RepID=A0A9P6U9X5_9FUNG|nr:hypothetical protein DFQ27_000556 [Actinomortierella ambigua]